MNPKLKKVIILAVVLMILCFGGIFLSTTLSNMKKTTITDFKIVDADNKLMKDQAKTPTDKFKLSVVITADGQNGGYRLYSTNPYVANVVWYDDGYYVECYNPGKAEIVAQSRVVENLRDSFTVNVSEYYFVDVEFDDSTVDDKKTIDVYADGFEYSYKFNLKGVTDEEGELGLNSRLFRVVETSNPDLFDKAVVNSETNALELSVKSRIEGKEGIESVVTSSNEYVVLQSYIRDSNGKEIVQDNYVVRVNIICNTIEDVQLEFCDDFDFDTDKTYIFSMLADEDYANSLINPDKEVLIRKVYCGKELPYLYFKVRLVYSNGSVSYITNDCTIYGFTNQAGDYDKQDPDDSMTASDYVNIFSISSDYSYDSITFNIEYGPNELTNFDPINRSFMFIVLEDSLDISELYKYDNDNKYYTFSYFDNRLKRFDTITDINGNIIKFEEKTTGMVYKEVKKDGLIIEYNGSSTDEVEGE